MKKTLRSGLLFLTILALLLTLTAAALPRTMTATGAGVAAAAANGGSYYNATAPNEIGIARLLMKQGKLTAKSTPAQIAAAVQAYARKKTAAQPKPTSEVKQELLSAGVSGAALTNMIYNQKYGAEKGQASAYKAKDKPADVVDQAKLLVLLVEFGNDDKGIGPLHNEIPTPGAADNSTFWVNNFSQEHFQSMLFTRGGYDAVDQNGKPLHLDSMTDYYLTQSNGMYEIDGVVYQWVQLLHSEAYYGDDDPEGGHDNLAPGTAKDVVKDAVAAADAAGLDFSRFDLENPYGVNESAGFYAPDGIIDHLVLVHAGIDQSGGGGLEGDNAIWAHSSAVELGSVMADGVKAYNYIIQGENCAIGTFTHEYGHDLGLPDEYDTQYSSPYGEPVGFWSLMSSGSWLGKPLDIKPSSISIWGRYALGWVTPRVVGLGNNTALLAQSVNFGRNEQSLRINLPPQVLQYPAQPQSGTGMWFSGGGDEYVASAISPIIALPTGASTLSYKTWFDIEEGWDFATIKLSTDGGATWSNLVSDRMTSDHASDAYPTIIDDDLPGYTGSSNGWITDNLDLSEYAGKNIQIKLLYQTDWGTSLTGIFFDDLAITNGAATVWQDACETAGAWTASNFRINNGTYTANHYYIAEWRQFRKTDASLANVYSFIDANIGEVDYFAYQPGLLLWYRNMAYSDNWVGIHPGYGFLGIVDANPKALLDANATPLRTRLAIYDATFNLLPGAAQSVSVGSTVYELAAKQGNPTFDDGKAYWYASAPYAGLKLPQYGIKLSVTETTKDQSVAKIMVTYKPKK